MVFSAAILNVFTSQVRELIERLPEYADTSTTWLNDNLGVDVQAEDVDEDAAQADTFLQDNFSNIVGGAIGAASTVLALLFRVMTILLFLFYILADAPPMASCAVLSDAAEPPGRGRAHSSLLSGPISPG